MVRACDADVVGLQEIGPVDLLRAVLSRLEDCRYAEPVVGTADSRGIRCALLARIRIVSSGVHTADKLSFPVFRDGDPEPFGPRIPLRRGVVHARIEAPTIGDVDVFVVHFKSPLPVPLRDATGVEVEAATARDRGEGALRSLVWRCAEGLYTRGLVDEVLAQNPGAHVAVVGDLNDVAESPAVMVLRGDGQGEGDLFDCAAGVPPEVRFSAFHRGRALQIDHVLATRALHARRVGVRFLNADLRDHGEFHPGGPEPVTIDSDHAPLVVRFE
jgi:endonuclease/exonuclease/phosphatase family metal-dependent hydrolase